MHDRTTFLLGSLSSQALVLAYHDKDISHIHRAMTLVAETVGS